MPKNPKLTNPLTPKTMKKATFIVGAPRTGKSTLARRIASEYKKSDVTFVSLKNNELRDNPFALSACQKTTKLLVLEARIDLSEIEMFYNLVPYGFPVYKKGETVFIINPDVVIVWNQDITDTQIKMLGPSFHARFDVVKCPIPEPYPQNPKTH